MRLCFSHHLAVIATVILQQPALAQDTTSEGDLEAVIADLQEGSPNYDDMEPLLRTAVEQQYTQVQSLLHQLGSIISVDFEGTQQGADIYSVSHQNGSTVWQFARSPSGLISVLWFRPL